MDHLCYFCLVFVMLSCASVYDALWSLAGKVEVFMNFGCIFKRRLECQFDLICT